jgi:hypothetical protein
VELSGSPENVYKEEPLSRSVLQPGYFWKGESEYVL